MKDRSVRRHQTFKTQRKNIKTYNSCIKNLPQSRRQALENNISKLRKACVFSHLEGSSKGAVKTLQERKHDITMKEQLSQV